MSYPRVGDRIEVTGIGRIFVDMVPGTTGKGRVVHVGTNGVMESSEFPNRERYEEMFPGQMAHGVFYMDEGLEDDGPYSPLFVAHEDAQVIEEEPENEE